MAILLAGCLAVYMIVEQCSVEDKRQEARAKRRQQIRTMNRRMARTEKAA